jgi:predicted transcriptional regulator
MFQPSNNRNSEKGMTQFLLSKRNSQFSALFKKLRDPVNIVKFYLEIRKVYKKYFGNERKADIWIEVLLYVYDKGHFWKEDLTKKFGCNATTSESILKSMGKRHLLVVNKERNLYVYTLSADGHLFITNFKKDCVSAMMKVMNESRSGKKKIYSTKKIKIKKVV